MSAVTPDRRPTAGSTKHDPVAAPLAVLLWLLVLAALTYGVWSTLGKVVKLFA
jgi:hypothetical protein